MAVVAPSRPSAPAPPAPAPPTRTRPRRLRGADELRALATVGVVVIHASYWAGHDPAVYSTVTLLARFSVPAFVVLGGLLLGYRHPSGAGPGFVGRRLRRSLLPWVAWAPVWCLAAIVLLGQLPATGGAVAGWWMGGGGHLYYLVLVPQLYVLFLVWPRGRRSVTVAAALAVAVQAALGAVRLAVPMSGGVARGVMLWHAYELAPFWIGYLGVGLAAGRHLAGGGRVPGARSAVAALGVAAVAGAALVAVGTGGAVNGRFAQGTGAFLLPLLLPFTLALCWAAVVGLPTVTRRSARLRRGVDVVARHSLGVYIVHPLLLAGVGRVFAPLLRGPLPLSATGLLLTVAVTLGAALTAVRVLAATRLARTLGEERTPLRRAPADAAERTLVGRRQPAA